MTVYHWTTETNAKSIMKIGLREGSFVCANPDDWRGEVCLVIESLNINTGDDAWQGITHRHIRPDEIGVG